MSESFRKVNLPALTPRTRSLLKSALQEDIGPGDITSQILIPKGAKGKAAIVAKESGLFCGVPLLEELFKIADPKLQVQYLVPDGKPFSKSKKVIQLKGRIHSILKSERTALNLLGHLSGIATHTNCFVRRIRRYPVMILDTRKTTPLWRESEKYAVRCGGGRNHRFGLYDEIFVKENHRKHGKLDRLKNRRDCFEIEVRSMNELKKALLLSPRVILFDNFTPAKLKQAVRYTRRYKPEIILEASGGITLDNVDHYAAMGVDWISIGSLTHSIRSLDFSLLVS